MAAKGMTDDTLMGIVEGWIADAEDFDTSDLALNRVAAIDFFEGKVDFDSEDGKSQVVSHDVSDTVNAILPGLLRVFLASDRIVEYEPRKEQDVQGAKQATDAINYIFMNECDGYRVLHNAMHDSLLLRNGVVKHWWDATKEYRTETLTGLDDEAMMALGSDDTVEEILEIRDYMVGPDGKEIEEGEGDGKEETSGSDASYV